MQMAKLDAGKRKRLRDSDFAYVDPSGRRRLPINDESHVRNALSRFNQAIFESEAARDRARTRLLNAAKRYGIVPVGFVTGQLRSTAPKLSTGAVTFLMTDIEGSTALLLQLEDRYGSLLADARRIHRCGRQAGRRLGDRRPGRRVLRRLPRRVRRHRRRDRDPAPPSRPCLARWRCCPRADGHPRGRPTLTDGGYVGVAVHTVARISSLGRGGQILICARRWPPSERIGPAS